MPHPPVADLAGWERWVMTVERQRHEEQGAKVVPLIPVENLPLHCSPCSSPTCYLKLLHSTVHSMLIGQVHTVVKHSIYRVMWPMDIHRPISSGNHLADNTILFDHRTIGLRVFLFGISNMWGKFASTHRSCDVALAQSPQWHYQWQYGKRQNHNSSI